MALMEDTGWYLPNYEMADELKWGSQLGKYLNIVKKSCRNRANLPKMIVVTRMPQLES